MRNARMPPSVNSSRCRTVPRHRLPRSFENLDMRATFAALLLLAVTTVAQAQSREWNGEPARPRPASQATDRIIVKWRNDASGPAIAARAEKLSQTTGTRVA